MLCSSESIMNNWLHATTNRKSTNKRAYMHVHAHMPQKIQNMKNQITQRRIGVGCWHYTEAMNNELRDAVVWVC